MTVNRTPFFGSEPDCHAYAHAGIEESVCVRSRAYLRGSVYTYFFRRVLESITVYMRLIVPKAFNHNSFACRESTRRVRCPH